MEEGRGGVRCIGVGSEWYFWFGFFFKESQGNVVELSYRRNHAGLRCAEVTLKPRQENVLPSLFFYPIASLLPRVIPIPFVRGRGSDELCEAVQRPAPEGRQVNALTTIP